MLSYEEYEKVRHRIEEMLENTDNPPRPAELLALLKEQGLPAGLASTVMWEMISAGAVALSTDRRLSLSQESAVPA